jgi:hypothetical protein
MISGVNDTSRYCQAVSMTPRIQLCKVCEKLSVVIDTGHHWWAVSMTPLMKRFFRKSSSIAPLYKFCFKTFVIDYHWRAVLMTPLTNGRRVSMTPLTNGGQVNDTADLAILIL